MSRITPEQEAYMYAHLDEDRRPYAIGMHCGFLLLGIVSVWLRFMSRMKIGAKLGADDWLILVALVSLAGHAICCIVVTQFGIGRHMPLISNRMGIAKTNHVGSTAYSCTLLFTKLSILALYHRIFSLAKGWIPTLWGIGAFILALGIVQPLVYIFQCIPITAVWAEHPPPDMKCIDFGTAIIALGVLHIITDWLLLFLPIPVVMGLHLNNRAKASICSLFAVGGATCIISIIRLQQAHSLDLVDPTWNYTPIQAISTVEGAIGILAACMPTWRPLFKFLSRGVTSYFSSGSRHATSNTASNPKLPHSSISSTTQTPTPKIPVHHIAQQHLSPDDAAAVANARAHKHPWISRSRRSDSNTSGDSVERMLHGRIQVSSDDVEMGDLGARRDSEMEDARPVTARKVEVSSGGIVRPLSVYSAGGRR
ncbi:unnamed protein product [Periconia digitata]|uniref:Rhodopsin domain-containing protein n=1 Tax=Periconia digitata TaxID=1303443 RepID=A0A9W4UUX5_9PLEO|nr:unnamed protein product [Periconia digitata]